jgi:hypothetical protein
MQGVISHGRDILRERKGYKEGVRAQAFLDKWGRVILYVGLVCALWAVSAQFSQAKYTEKDMRAAQIEYFNLMKQRV